MCVTIKTQDIYAGLFYERRKFAKTVQALKECRDRRARAHIHRERESEHYKQQIFW
jgi:hypothetical protein